eukprot:1161901-Pyramimonas_sp.AAC.1
MREKEKEKEGERERERERERKRKRGRRNNPSHASLHCTACCERERSQPLPPNVPRCPACAE